MTNIKAGNAHKAFPVFFIGTVRQIPPYDVLILICAIAELNSNGKYY